MKKRVSIVIIGLIVFFATTSLAEDPRLVIDTGGHKAKIRDVIFTGDGRYLVSAGDDKVVRVWEVKTGEIVRTIRGRIGDGAEGMIYAAALSPDERYLAVGGFLGKSGQGVSGRIRIHDFKTGAVIGLLKGHKNVVVDLAFSPDSQYLASGSYDETVRIWDVAQMTQQHVLTGHKDNIYAVTFSPDGKRVVSGSYDHTLRLWDTRQGRLIKEMTGHEDRVQSADFSPNGRYIASGSWDKTVRLWDAKSGEFIKILGSQGTNVSSLSFSPDSQWLLTGSGLGGQYICNIFSVPSGEVITRFEKHDNTVLATAVSGDGRLAATGGGTDNEIYLWTPQTGDVIKKLVGKGQSVWSVGFAKDGGSIVFGNQSNYQNDNNRGPLQHIISLKQDGDYRVELGGEIKNEANYLRASDRFGAYELKTKKGGAYGYHAVLQVIKDGTVLHEIERVPASGYHHRCYSFTHDGRFIVSGAGNGFLSLYDRTSDKKIHDFVGHTGDVWSVAVSADNRTLVSGSFDQTIRLWDIQSGKNLLTVFVGSDREWVAWTPQGYYTSSLKGDRYIGWHLNQGEDRAAQYYLASQFQKQFYRPDVLAAYLQARDIAVAVRRANEARGRKGAPEPVMAAKDLRGILPPMVYVAAPQQPEITVFEENFSVKAVALSNTLPITDVKVYLNGIQVAGKRQGKLKGNPMKRPVELVVSLQPGVNTLTIWASNDKSSSEPELRRIIYQGSKRAPKPDLILLAIGISAYENQAYALDFAHRDAADVAGAFQKQQGRIFGQVKFKVLKDQEAHRAAIIRGLNWLSKEGTQRDTRVLFLSGHGGLDSRNNYFFYAYRHDPGEDPEIFDVKWSTMLDKLTSAQSKAMLLVDTCHAAAATGSTRTKGTVDITQVLKELQTEYRGVVTYAASTGREVSIEKAEWGYGAFTKALLEGLEGQADGYGGKKDGVIDTKELGSWIIDRVKELTGGEQHATHSQPSELPVFPVVVLK